MAERLDFGRLAIGMAFVLLVIGYCLPAQAQPWPDFSSALHARGPIISTVRGGLWSDPGSWDLGRIPQPGDTVRVEHLSLMHEPVDVHTITVRRGGYLIVDPGRLRVCTLQVLRGGGLTIGTEYAPATVDIEFANCDMLGPELDPEQAAGGLLVEGYLSVHGRPLERTFVRLAEDAMAGDSELVTEGGVLDWQPGDEVWIPDTRQVPAGLELAFRRRQFERIGQHWESRRIAAIDGERLILDRPLEHDHLGLGGRRAHVANLTRSVTMRSEDPNGTRAHVIATEMADVDIRYAAFESMGRTTNDRLDPLLNHVARYPVHMHHLHGTHTNNSGYRFRIQGNAVRDGLKWAVTVHNSSAGLVADNVVVEANGAGIMLEDGTEQNNQIVHNFVAAIQGTNHDHVSKPITLRGDYARGGSCIWAASSTNRIEDNVMADCSYGGLVITHYYLKTRVADIAPGPIRNNEVYGLGMHALWTALPGHPKTYQYLVEGLRAWNLHHAYVRVYHTSNFELRDFDFASSTPAATGLSMAGPYECERCSFVNGAMTGLATGATTPKNDDSERDPENALMLTDLTIQAQTGVLVHLSEGSTGSARPRHTIVENMRFTAIEGGPAIEHRLIDPRGDVTPLTEIRTTVRAFNGVAGDDFTVWHEGSPWACASPESREWIVGWVCP